MPNVEEISAGIEERIRALHAEREVLEAARTELVRGGGTARRNRAAAPATRRRAAGRPAAAPPAAAPPAAAPPVADPPAGTSARAGGARAQPATSTRSRRRRTALTADALAEMLAEHPDGLSAITISKRADAAYRDVTERLRELEAAGRIRRSGARRTSLWHLVTDEDWIAQRTAELERIAALGSAPSPPNPASGAAASGGGDPPASTPDAEGSDSVEPDTGK